MKWNESGFRPPLCTYRLSWARRTSWGWWDDWDDTVLQTQDSKFEPWRSEAEHATSRSRRLPIIMTFTRGWGRNIFCFFQTAETGNRTPNSGVKGIASLARFECLILHFIARSSIYKCWNVIFNTQSRMAARNDQENVQNFSFSCKYFRSICFIMKENPYDRCHLVQRQPLSENHMISVWFVE